jgi:hypothetical protein
LESTLSAVTRPIWRPPICLTCTAPEPIRGENSDSRDVGSEGEFWTLNSGSRIPILVSGSRVAPKAYPEWVEARMLRGICDLAAAGFPGKV